MNNKTINRKNLFVFLFIIINIIKILYLIRKKYRILTNLNWWFRKIKWIINTIKLKIKVIVNNWIIKYLKN